MADLPSISRKVAVVVPKYDELTATGWAFGVDLSADPDEVTPGGTQLYRRTVGGVSITFAFLDRQNVRYATIGTAEVSILEEPEAVFLVGTALGKPGSIGIGSVVVPDTIVTADERRIGATSWRYQSTEPARVNDYFKAAARRLSRQFSERRVAELIRKLAQDSEVPNRPSPDEAEEFIKQHKPKVTHEELASGSDYFMFDDDTPPSEPWQTCTKARAWDMETAGFVTATLISNTPWLVVRGISDLGVRDSKSDINRTIAAALAASYVADYIQNQLPVMSAASGPLAQAEFRLDGVWEGFWAFLDDEGEFTVLQDTANISQRQERSAFALVSSTLVQGAFDPRGTTYVATLELRDAGYIRGTWQDVDATTQYYGTLLGRLSDKSHHLEGLWLGNHQDGIRVGVVEWWNVERGGKALKTERPDVEDFIASARLKLANSPWVS